MKRKSKSLKKRTNKINTKKRYSIKGYYTGGKIMPPKWKQYGHITEAEYLEEQREQIERERARMREIEKKENVIKAVLTNVFINFIMTLIMNPDQSQRFETYIRENIRIVNNRGELDVMIDDFINFARSDLLDEQQISLINKIMDAVQQERAARMTESQPFRTLDIMDVIERVFTANNDLSRSGGGKKKYYKRFSRKNKFNSRK